MNGAMTSHFALKALRGLLADAASDEDFGRARRFADLNGLDYPERASMPTRSVSVARSARGRAARRGSRMSASALRLQCMALELRSDRR
jgi:hypothetical protein